MRTSTAVLFLDLQDAIVSSSRTVPGAQLLSRAVILAELAALHKLPVFASSVQQGGAFHAELLAPSGVVPHARQETTAFADSALTGALAATGRRQLILAGVASEIVVQRTALDALAAGYAVQVAVDASGGLSERTEEAAWRRLTSAGAVTTSVPMVAAELAGDFTTDLGGATLGLLYRMLSE